MKLLAVFFAGLITGALGCWLCIRATLKTYQTYIHERISHTTDTKEGSEQPVGFREP